MQSTAPTKPRRFRVRFGLRSVLVLITLVAMLLAWVAAERRESARQREIADQLSDAGFTFRFGGPYDSYELYEYDEPQGWWRDLARILLGERALDATCDQHTEISDLSSIAILTDLQSLDVSHTDVEDLSPLADLYELRCLAIVETKVSDITPLAGLMELRELWLLETKVVDFSPLAGLKKLESLEISGAPVSEAQKRMLLESLPNLIAPPILFEELRPASELRSFDGPATGQKERESGLIAQ